jgi:hypothetical protein
MEKSNLEKKITTSPKLSPKQVIKDFGPYNYISSYKRKYNEISDIDENQIPIKKIKLN